MMTGSPCGADFNNRTPTGESEPADAVRCPEATRLTVTAGGGAGVCLLTAVAGATGACTGLAARGGNTGLTGLGSGAGDTGRAGCAITTGGVTAGVETGVTGFVADGSGATTADGVATGVTGVG